MQYYSIEFGCMCACFHLCMRCNKLFHYEYRLKIYNIYIYIYMQ